MKKYFIILFLSNVYILAQTYVADYSYTVDRKEFHTFSRFPAKLLINKDVKLYTVDYGLNEKSSSQYVVSRLKHQYKQYSDSKTNIYIDDIIQDKQSFFVDKKPVMKWTLTKDVKINDKIKLKKATTSFRGRNYTIWYDDKVKISQGPWKFYNVPGLVYEAYDDNKDFSWKLLLFSKEDEAVKNPFQDSKIEFKDYNEYPKLRYGLSPELKLLLSANPDNKMTEQERNGLEIKFEWEEK